jgi:hypothetical protein
MEAESFLVKEEQGWLVGLRLYETVARAKTAAGITVAGS